MPAWSRYRRHRGFFFFGILLIIGGVVIGYVIAQNNQPKVSHTVDEIEGFEEGVNNIVKKEIPKVFTVLNNVGVSTKTVDVSCDRSGKWVTVTDGYLVFLPKQTKRLVGVIQAKTTPICCKKECVWAKCYTDCDPCEGRAIYYRKIRYRLKRWSGSSWIFTSWSEVADFDTSNTNKWTNVWWIPLTLQNLDGDYYWWVEIQIKTDLADCGIYDYAKYSVGGMHLHAVT